MIQQNINTLFAEAETQSDYGFGYPSYVKQEYERYMSCGMFCDIYPDTGGASPFYLRLFLWTQFPLREWVPIF